MKGCRQGYALVYQAGLCASKAGCVPLEQGAGSSALHGLHHQATHLTQPRTLAWQAACSDFMYPDTAW